MQKNLPPVNDLRVVLRYQPETGLLFWLPRERNLFASDMAYRTWNGHWANREAFTCTNNRGYRVGRVFGTLHQAHRVIWALVTGDWPQASIDHKNGARSDNKWENLRLATDQQNSVNRKKKGGTSSVYHGVTFRFDIGKWSAQLKEQGKHISCGVFATELEAAQAYDSRAQQLRGPFAKLNFPAEGRVA
jgi:hypothetical protein